jgi:hypothetical protein
MIVFEIMYDNVVVGLVVNKDGNLTSDAALSAWNAAKPSYQGDSAVSSPFIEA